MGLFDIDFKLVADRCLPTHKRGDVNLSWIGALLKPLQDFSDSVLIDFRNDIIKRTKYSSQTIVLEQILNDIFSITEPPFIFITNSEGGNVDVLIFRNQAEGFPPIFFRNDSEIPEAPIFFRNSNEVITEFDFIVYVPSAVFATEENRIIAIVNELKLIGVNFNVVAY